MPEPFYSGKLGRLFWKLVFALFLSMALALVGTTLYISFSTESTPELLEGAPMLGRIPIVPLLTGLIAAVIIGLLFAWYLSRPIRKLSWALRRISQGSFDTRVSPLMMRKWRDEIVDLGVDFDCMAEQLQRGVESQRSLLHDVSHELRSPLTRMQAAIGLLRQNPGADIAMIARIEAESKRLDALIEEFLTLHRLDAGAAESQCDRVDLIELLQAIVEDAQFEAHAAGKKVTLSAGKPFVSKVKGELIYRAFENVIRNAVKFTPPGETVSVQAWVGQDDTLEVHIADRGPGVPPELCERIFDPFFRIEGRGNTEGTGLGLAIAHKAITMHGGKIQAIPRKQGGLLVRILLPMRPEPPVALSDRP